MSEKYLEFMTKNHQAVWTTHVNSSMWTPEMKGPLYPLFLIHIVAILASQGPAKNSHKQAFTLSGTHFLL